MEHFRGSGDTGWGELVMSGGYGRQSEDQVQAAAVSSAQNWYSKVTKPGLLIAMYSNGDGSLHPAGLGGH